MASDRKTFAAQDSDLGNVVGDWLDPFADDASIATGRVAVDADTDLPFSEWCVLPVAFVFVIGDMMLQFWR